MIIENLNIRTVLIFIVIIGLITFITGKYYNYKKENSKRLKKVFNNFELKSYKIAILLLSFFVLTLSIFKFKGGEIRKDILKKGVDIMFVLDVSKSMNTADINYGNYKTTRLNIAKKAIEQYISKHGENRYGLVIFAGDAIGTIPLTNDKNIFLTLLQGVDFKNLNKQGTNFNKALQVAVGRFKNKSKGKVLVFISDGGDNGDYNGLNVKFPKDIKSIVIGVGTEQGGKIILGQDAFGDYKYQTYKGNYVITKLNEKNLKKLANDIDGKYIQLNNIQKINEIDNYIQNLEKQSIKVKEGGERQDLTRYILMISFVIFLIYLGLEIINIFPMSNKK